MLCFWNNVCHTLIDTLYKGPKKVETLEYLRKFKF